MRNLKENQESAIRVATSRHSDVVMNSYKNIKIIRATSPKDKAILIVFRGKSSKPIANYFYPTYERREEAVVNHKKTADSHEEWDLKKKAEKAARPAPKSKVGDIFVNSWGYDQTNVDYYQVIERPSVHFAIVRKIGSEMVEGSAGFDCCNLLPVKDSFLEGDRNEPMRVKITNYGKGSEYIKINSYSSASTWDGRENYCSWYH